MTFHAFFHISEFEEDGYRALPCVLSVCDQVTLWAPPTRAITSITDAPIDPGEFLGLVEEGRLRVIARQEWLTDPDYRNRLSGGWPDAAWDPQVDGVLKRLMEEDTARPDPRSRRVVAVPPQDGPRAALELLNENEPTVQHLANQLEREPWHVPPGVAAAAARTPVASAPNQYRLALSFIKDARNHADAIHLAGAQVPVLMGDASRDLFNSWVSWWQYQVQAPTVRDFVPREAAGLPAARQAALFGELMELLRSLSTARRHGHHAILTGDAHRELASWYSDALVDILEHSPDGALPPGLIRGRLDEHLNQHRYPALREAALSSARSPVGFLQSLLTAAGLVVDPSSKLNLMGVVVNAITWGQSSGSVPQTVETGPNWPYLYAFGGKATRRRKERLHAAIQGHA